MPDATEGSLRVEALGGSVRSRAAGRAIGRYYTLSATGVKPRNLSAAITRRLPRYPIVPATLPGRLAVDRKYQGRGYGRSLLAEALYRTVRSQIASFAVVVDAEDEAARRFHERESFLPRQTVHGWFAAWRDAGLWQSITNHLIMQDRERTGRGASPSAAVIDSQSIKTTEAGGPRGYDAGKKVLGRKRHAMVDADGRLLSLEAHPASAQDRDGAVPLLQASRRRFPFVELVFADAAYAGERVANDRKATTLLSKQGQAARLLA